MVQNQNEKLFEIFMEYPTLCTMQFHAVFIDIGLIIGVINDHYLGTIQWILLLSSNDITSVISNNAEWIKWIISL